jgi:hypothetical protein
MNIHPLATIVPIGRILGISILFTRVVMSYCDMSQFISILMLAGLRLFTQLVFYFGAIESLIGEISCARKRTGAMSLNEYYRDSALGTGEALGSALEASLVFLVIICWLLRSITVSL